MDWIISLLYFSLLWFLIWLAIRHGRKQGYQEAEIIIHDRVQVEDNLIYINAVHVQTDIEKAIVIFKDKACVYEKKGEI